MKKELSVEVEIPEGVEVELNEGLVKVKGKEGELSREFHIHNLDFKKDGNKIIIGNKESTKREKKIMNTIVSHITNMIKGVQEKFVYELKVCFSHFPMTVENNGREILIKNFLGEKISRKTTLPEGVEVKVDKEIITLSGINKEIVGQAAAKIEAATSVGNRDRRVFQDGIFLISKAGKEI